MSAITLSIVPPGEPNAGAHIQLHDHRLEQAEAWAFVGSIFAPSEGHLVQVFNLRGNLPHYWDGSPDHSFLFTRGQWRQVLSSSVDISAQVKTVVPVGGDL